MTRLMQALRHLMDALRDKPETPDVEGVMTVFATPSDSEVRTRFMK